MKEVPKDDLVSVISHELKINSDNATAEMDRLLLEYCIDNPPEEVMRKFISYPNLLKLAEKIFHQRPPNSVPENEIINSILSILGFNNPPKLVGLKKYQEILKQNSDKIDVTVDEVILIANETDKILRNLIEFYSKFLWDIKRGEDFKKIISDNFEIKKHFSKLSSGELVGILRNLIELVHTDKTMADKMIHNFNHDYLIPAKNIEENKQALKKLIEFSNEIQENVYPLW
ncbi:MAG: hypothetical protein Q8P40_02540 [Nitrospirota bacterium]|nr:hypothetical protein [Nitrospirota bacterium]